LSGAPCGSFRGLGGRTRKFGAIASARARVLFFAVVDRSSMFLMSSHESKRTGNSACTHLYVLECPSEGGILATSCRNGARVRLAICIECYMVLGCCCVGSLTGENRFLLCQKAYFDLDWCSSSDTSAVSVSATSKTRGLECTQHTQVKAR
jgi:hypothetical protein